MTEYEEQFKNFSKLGLDEKEINIVKKWLK